MALEEIALDTDHDLLLRGGRLQVLTNAEAVGQRVKVRLLTLLGEWRFDVARGTPWVEQILGRAPDLTLIRSILRRRIAETEGVAEVVSLSLTVTPGAGVLTVSARLRTDDGDVAVTLEV